VVCLELFDKLLDNALELEILFSKIKDKESERHVYSVPLEYYISKETEILKSISASDLENLVSYMKSRYGFTFDGLFFPKFFLYKDNHLCVLRVYRQIFQLNQFYQLQKLSNVSCFEAEKLSISSYMVGVKNQANAISLFESILLNNYLTLDSKYESKLSYLYLTLDNKSCVKKDVFSSSFIEDVLKFVGCDIYELSNSIFEHCFNSEFLSIFQSYFFSLEEEYRQDIFQFIKAAYLKCKEHNESLSCDWVTDFLKDYFVGQLNFSLIEPLAIKPSAKIKNFSFSELSYFDSIFFSLMDMTKEIWHFCKVVMESKANNEPTESRTIYYEKIKSLLANREMFMDKIVNFEDFQEYVLLVYGVEEIDPLFLVSLTSSVIHNSSLEDIEVEYSLIEEFVVRFILESSKSIELDSKIEQDGISTSLYEPDIDEVSMRVSKLEKVLKAFISYFRSHSTEEDFRNSFILSNKLAPTFKKWLIKCYSQADYIITPTPYSKRLLEGYGLKQSIQAISNGIDLTFFKSTKNEGPEFRKTYGYKKEDIVIVGIGLYLERKGILDFVELAKRMPEYQFIWFGHVNKAVIPKKIKRALRVNLPNLKFPGYVEPSMIRSALKESNLYIFPTLEETEGIPAMEACAMKCDAIVRDIPVFDDWLEDGKNIYKAKNINDFEIKIRKIINKELPSLVKEGYKVAESRDIKKIGEELKKVYEEVMKM